MTSRTADRRRSSRSSDAVLARTPRPASVLIMAGAFILILTVVGFVLKLTQPDMGLAAKLNRHHVGTVATVTNLVYHVFSPAPAIIITIAITGFIWFRRRDVRPAAAFAGIVALTWIPSDIVKIVVGRPRPLPQLLSHPFTPTQVDASYPSGHMVFVCALTIAVFMVLRRSRWALPVAVVGTVVIVIVAAALTIDAVHFVTDVLASVVWSVTVAPAARLVWVDWIMPRVPVLRQRH